MKIWIDADAAPRDVKETVFRTAQRLQIPVVLVTNQNLFPPLGQLLVTVVRVGGGRLDIADQHIVEHAEVGDLAITADVPLAALLVEKGITAIDPRGAEYTEDNVGDRLAVRDLMTGLREAGLESGGPRPYAPKDKQNFAVTLDRVVTRLLRRAKKS
jgi:uncharacterized protein